MGWACCCNKSFDQTSAKLCALAQMKECAETVSRIITFLHHQIKTIQLTSCHHVWMNHLSVWEVTQKKFCGVRSVVTEQLMWGGKNDSLTSPMQVLWLVVLLKCRVEKLLKKAKQTKIQVEYGNSKWAYWSYRAWKQCWKMAKVSYNSWCNKYFWWSVLRRGCHCGPVASPLP